MAKNFLGPSAKFTEISIPKPQHFKKTLQEESEVVDIQQDIPQSTDSLEKEIPIIRKHSSQPTLRKLKLSKPSFDPTEGIDFDKFASKKEAFLMGYLNALYHRLDGVKKVK